MRNKDNNNNKNSKNKTCEKIVLRVCKVTMTYEERNTSIVLKIKKWQVIKRTVV